MGECGDQGFGVRGFAQLGFSIACIHHQGRMFQRTAPNSPPTQNRPLPGKTPKNCRGGVHLQYARTTLNFYDAPATRMAATVRIKLVTQLDRPVNGLSGSGGGHFGGTLDAAALPGMNKYRTAAGDCNWRLLRSDRRCLSARLCTPRSALMLRNCGQTKNLA